MKDTVTGFYAELTPFYHLIYPDWEKSMERQASVLDAIIRETWGPNITSILDVSCGIGTQCLGLSRLGYEVKASDISPEGIERAQLEAAERGLSISFSEADMREAFTHHARQFDVVISCDNAIPHLLTDDDILTAFQQFHACTRPGGGCMITVRDYEKENLDRQAVKLYDTREKNGVVYLIFQKWDFVGQIYDLSMYIVEDRGGSDCETYVMRSRYYAVSIDKLCDLMKRAGFSNVRRLDDRFFQPVIIGTRDA